MSDFCRCFVWSLLVCWRVRVVFIPKVATGSAACRVLMKKAKVLPISSSLATPRVLLVDIVLRLM